MLRLKQLIILLICLLVSMNIYAQEAQDEPATGPSEPENTEIILPPMYLEIEDLSVEDINAVIPDEDSVYLSAVDMDLPEPGDITIPVEVFAVSGMEVPSARTDGDEPADSFFSESTIGLGTAYNITGDINLYKIGGQPDFRLRYYHDGYDGFAGQDAGEGYSFREELIEAEMNYTGENLSSDIILDYNEIETGLQGQADYSSMTHRIAELDTVISWMLLENLELTGGLDASAAGMTLNSGTSLGCNVYTLNPEAGLWFGGTNLKAGLHLGYDLEGSFPLASQAGLFAASQLLDVSLGFVGIVSEELKLEAEAGVLLEDYATFLFPFDATVSGTVGGVFDYSLGGGYKAEQLDYNDLWDDYAYTSAPYDSATLSSLPVTHGWFGGGNFSWNITDDFAVKTAASFSSLTDALMPGTSTLTGLGSLETYDCTSLTTSAELFFRFTDDFSVTAGWEGQLLEEIDLFAPLHRFYADVEINSEDQNMGIVTKAEFNIYDSTQTWYVNDWLPELGFEAYLRFSDSLMLSVLAEDLASGLLTGGRYSWNGYLDRGLFLQIKTKISL